MVDDHSTDDTAECARAMGVRVVPSKGRGAAAARNTGALAAQGELILFTDGDCIPCPGWARNLVLPFEQPDVVATKGAYRTRQVSLTARFVQAEYEERYARMLSVREVDFLDTYSLAVRREELLAIGGFDEGFQGASVEDQEMSFRLLERGKFRFVPDAVVDHQHADSPRVYARKKFRIGQGKATLLRRHPDRIKGDSHTPDTLRWQVGATLAAGALAPIAIFSSIAALLCVLGALSPVFLSGPLLGRCLRRHSGAFLPTAVALVLLRGWALSSGFAWGVVRPLARLGSTVTPLDPVTAAERVVTEAPTELPTDTASVVLGDVDSTSSLSEQEVLEGESGEVRVFDPTP